MEYTVVDCGTAGLNGDFLLLRDDKSQNEQVTACLKCVFQPGAGLKNLLTGFHNS
jgi:hypothetical protein